MVKADRIDTDEVETTVFENTTIEDAVKEFVWAMVSELNIVTVENCANGISVSVKIPRSENDMVWLFHE